MKTGKAISGKSYPLTRHGFICAVSRKESSSDLSQSLSAKENVNAAKIKNDLGYIGFFQFGEAALIDLGYYNHWNNNSDKTKKNDWTGSWVGQRNIKSLNQFLNSPSLQIQVIDDWINFLCKKLRGRSFNEYYGKIINGIEITESGAIAGSHLVGDGGLGSFLGVPGFKGKYKESDGNNVHISKYIEMFNHYDLESCCERKIYISLKNQIGQVVKNKKVVVESTYNGKFKQPKFAVSMESDDHGILPVIVRHPGSQIIVKVDGKQSKVITQEAAKKQSLELKVSEDITVEAVLAKPAEPQKIPDKITVVQEAQPGQENTVAKQTNEVKFDLAIVEGDTGKKITNMRFFLKYRGKIKEHVTDGTGIKAGVIADEGESIEVLVSGNKAHQKIKTIAVSKQMENTCITVPLNTLSVKLKVHDQNNKVVKNSVFFVAYRGRQIEKKTDNNGFIHLKMLNAFVYKLLLKNKKEVLVLRNDASVSIINVKLNDAAIRSQQNIATSSNTQTKPSSPEPKDKTPEKDDSLVDHIIELIPSLGETKNTHTAKNGNPLTKVYGIEVSFTVKTINKATNKEENLPYSIKYKGAKKSHYSGQDGIGLKKHRGEQGQAIEVSIDSNGKEQVLYSATLQQPMPVIELKIEKPKDDGQYLYPLKTSKKTDSYKKGFATFGSSRSKGKRKHGGCDLYAPAGTEVRAMAKGIVRNVYPFYDNTDAIEIKHGKHIIRYGEVMTGKSLVKRGDEVARGQPIGFVGNLTTKGIPSMMLHLEMYSDVNNEGTLSGNSIYKRRSDLIDPTPFLDKSTL